MQRTPEKKEENESSEISILINDAWTHSARKRLEQRKKLFFPGHLPTLNCVLIRRTRGGCAERESFFLRPPLPPPPPLAYIKSGDRRNWKRKKKDALGVTFTNIFYNTSKWNLSWVSTKKSNCCFCSFFRYVFPISQFVANPMRRWQKKLGAEEE